MGIQQQIDQNIEAVRSLERRLDSALDPAAVRFQTLAAQLGKPRFLRVFLILTGLWITINLLLPVFGRVAFDPFPFAVLQGLLSLSALTTSLVVLIGQNHEAMLDAQRAHIHLQVSLLGEQKVTKLIALVEELRRDIPSVQNRLDMQAERMQRATDPEALLGTFDDAAQPSESVLIIPNGVQR